MFKKIIIIALIAQTFLFAEFSNTKIANSVTVNRIYQGAMEVRYQVNSSGSGWNNCVIDGIYLY